MGDIVTCTYKTGSYYGELLETNDSRGTGVVKILAVKRHPRQGDLHNPNQTDVPFFHERPALSYQEKANIPLNQIKIYTGTVPDYTASLQEAADEYERRLEEGESSFDQQSLETLRSVRRGYPG
ncbi:kinase-associated lipoprotein B [Alkalicoccus urumqiensis]